MLSSKYNYDRNAIDQQPRGDYSAIMIASLSLVLIGIFMILGGGTVTFVYYTEITPQNHEAYYDRYVSTNASRILGPILLMLGLIVFWGGNIFFVYAYYKQKASISRKKISLQ